RHTRFSRDWSSDVCSSDLKKRVVTKIGSLAAPDGSQAIGPSDISFSRGKAYFTVGLGADPRMRAQLPRLGQKTNGWLLKKSWHRSEERRVGQECRLWVCEE